MIGNMISIMEKYDDGLVTKSELILKMVYYRNATVKKCVEKGTQKITNFPMFNSMDKVWNEFLDKYVR